MNDTDPFEDAVASLLQLPNFGQLVDAVDQREESAKGANKLLLVGNLATQEELKPSPLQPAVIDLVERAATCAETYDALNLALGMRVLNQWKLGDAGRAWVFGVLRGDYKRPKSAGGPNKLEAKIRKNVLAMLVGHAENHGLLPFRNAASDPHSACDAVVAALAEHGHHKSYDTVAKAYQHSTRNGG